MSDERLLRLCSLCDKAKHLMLRLMVGILMWFGAEYLGVVLAHMGVSWLGATTSGLDFDVILLCVLAACLLAYFFCWVAIRVCKRLLYGEQLQ